MKQCLCMLLLSVFVMANLVGYRFLDENNKVLKNNDILHDSIKSIDTTIVSLQDIAPFEWDNVYVFSPYTSKETIEDIIGFKDSRIKVTVDETMQQLIFVKDNQIVCNIYGYSDKLGYEFIFKISDDYLMFGYSDNVSFKADNEKGYISLVHT